MCPLGRSLLCQAEYFSPSVSILRLFLQFATFLQLFAILVTSHCMLAVQLTDNVYYTRLMDNDVCDERANFKPGCVCRIIEEAHQLSHTLKLVP